MIVPRKGLPRSCPVPSPFRLASVLQMGLGRHLRQVRPISTPPGKTMKIRNSLSAALIVGVFTVLAPIYGPVVGARAATPQDELDKSMKSLAGAYSILQQNAAEPI